MRKRANKLVITSRWKNENGKICYIISTKDPNEDNIPKITFGGYNPFPCYSMMAPYHTVAEWMVNNGWELLPGGNRVWSGDVLNSYTGEITGEYFIEEYFIPVKD